MLPYRIFVPSVLKRVLPNRYLSLLMSRIMLPYVILVSFDWKRMFPNLLPVPSVLKRMLPNRILVSSDE